MAQTQRISHAERTEISDAKMLTTAIEQIAVHGTSLLTLKDIGEQSGYSRGLAGYRFGNKAGLLEYVFRAVAAEWLEALKSATKNKTGEAAISAAIDAHYEYCIETPYHFTAFYTLWFESIGAESPLQKVVTNIHQRRAKDVAEWINAGINNGDISDNINAEEVANFFCAMIVGIVYQWLLSPAEIEPIKSLYQDLKRTMRSKLEITKHNEK